VKIKYTEKRFTRAIKELLDSVIQIVEEYRRQGYTMTLRQLYYQLVSRDIIPNQQREYNRLSRILTDARMTGLVDWDFIEDRIRRPQLPNEFAGIRDLVEVAVNSYRLGRWADQPNYVEVWTEKDALSGVLAPVTEEYHVSLLVDRGYISTTAVHEGARRFRDAAFRGKECYLLYLGDHDPSGEDMFRDIKARLRNFHCTVNATKIALTMAQVTEYNPPPNPAKMTDTRASKYVARHGNHSWELDALPPDALNELLKVNLDQLLDRHLYDAMIEREEQDKNWLRSLARDREESRNDF